MGEAADRASGFKPVEERLYVPDGLGVPTSAPLAGRRWAVMESLACPGVDGCDLGADLLVARMVLAGVREAFAVVLGIEGA